ncbi:hypothetical protein EJ08DRAFT_277677 [Tothia fuscella]|uniref:Uncharacterized protein n=1 Tax=Tothia fuscella TaxID=1048955 RepID=A0A9P4NQ25_9PEZI|nr:hypothetical protein EJ08DRAFT_277677 [Tothia fuscella]
MRPPTNTRVAANMADASSNHFPFFKLAREIRDMIYKYALVQKPIKFKSKRAERGYDDASYEARRVPKGLLCLPLTCKQTHEEAMLILYGVNFFKFRGNYSTCLAWLDSLPKATLPWIHSLNFELDSGYWDVAEEVKRFFILLKELVNLQWLSITLASEAPEICVDGVWFHLSGRSVNDELVSANEGHQLRMELLCTITGLRRLSLQVSEGERCFKSVQLIKTLRSKLLTGGDALGTNQIALEWCRQRLTTRCRCAYIRPGHRYIKSDDDVNGKSHLPESDKI